MSLSKENNKKRKSAERPPLSPSMKHNIGRSTRRQKTTNDTGATKSAAATTSTKSTTSAKGVAEKNIPSPIDTNIEATIDRLLRKQMKHSAKVPEDLEQNTNYHPKLIEVGRAINKFETFFSTKLLPKIKTKDGKTVILNLPSLPWGLGKNEKLLGLSLNYLTSQEGIALNGLSCFTAERSDGSLRCRCLEFLRLLATDNAYYAAILLDQIPIALPYEMSLSTYVGKVMATKIMGSFSNIVMSAILQHVDKLALCAQSASNVFSQNMFGSEKALKKIFANKKDSNHDLVRQKILSIDKDSFETAPHPCTFLHKEKRSHFDTKAAKADALGTLIRRFKNNDATPCNFLSAFADKHSVHFALLTAASIEASIRGGTESGRMMSKSKLAANDLIERGLAQTKRQAAELLTRYITGETKEKKEKMQKKYLSCCELELASDIATTLVDTGLFESNYQAAISEVMVDSIMEKGSKTKDEAESIAKRYTSLQEGLQKRLEVLQDEVYTKHFQHMSRLWESGDPKTKVAVEVEGCQVYVLYVQHKGETKNLYCYIKSNLMTLPKEDPRYHDVEQFNLHLWSQAATELRKQRAKGKN